MDTSCKHPADNPDDWHSASPVKRKKIRRGTRSCWECKRRKMKCVFDSPDDAVCIGCHRRWTKCVSQEFPEEVSAPLDNSRQLRDRLRRVESRLDHFLRHADGPYKHTNTSAEIQTDKPCRDPLTPVHTPSAAVVPADLAGPNALSLALYDALPSPEDTASICRASGAHSIPVHEILTTPYGVLDQDGFQSQNRLIDIPGPNVHPVLIARHLLHLASFLQHLHPDLHEGIRGLSEPPQTMRERLADMAIRLVTTNDKFVGSIEFLECIMVESLYQANCGYLRRSWMTARRAMTIAQSMGFHRSGGRVQYKILHPETKAYPHFMWFRIVFYDRQMCLMLGMPQGTLDRSMASDAMLAKDSPSDRLERIHCVIASRILERNEADPVAYDYSWTQNLDKELQRSARSMPTRWWLMPNLSGEKRGSQSLFWEMRRLSAQLFYYNLLNQLHLPYMLRDSAERKYDYSRITCVNSSREILSRFIMLRRWNQVAFSCRTIDFTALMAAMTLLLAHLDSHRSPRVDNFLAAQNLGDRAMIEQAQENMDDLNRLNTDALSARSARLLRRLLAIEAKAADGDLQSAQSVSVQVAEIEEPQSDDSTRPSNYVYIPYFGVIQAAGDSQPDDMIQTKLPQENDRQSQHPAIALGIEAQTHSKALAVPSSPSVPSNNNKNNSVAALFTPLLSEILSNNPMQHFEYQGMGIGIEDGVFQDVDFAFLDNLVGGADEDGNAGTEWATA